MEGDDGSRFNGSYPGFISATVIDAMKKDGLFPDDNDMDGLFPR